MSHETNTAESLPLVMQVGFSGSRRLYGKEIVGDELARLEASVSKQLVGVLTLLRADLGLSAHHFLCGISQMAIGADMAFAKACVELKIPHRVFLPQHRDSFLEAAGSSGPDFTEEQRQLAQTYLDHENVIQEQVVSDSGDRGTRFEEANLEILRVSDVIVCVLRSDAEEKVGGARRIMTQALNRGVPVLEVRVNVVDDEVVLTSTWHGKEQVGLPSVSQALAGVHCSPEVTGELLPSSDRYVGRLKAHGSETANWLRKLFQSAAFLIIFFHVMATLISTYNLVWGHDDGGAGHGEHAVVDTAAGSSLLAHNSTTTVLVIVEILLVGTGLGIHVYLHTSHTAGNWAISRVVAEVSRSALAVGKLPAYLEYLFRLPLPRKLRPVLRTVNVLHLRTARLNPVDDWKELQQTYLNKRIAHQVDFYQKKIASTGLWQKVSQWTFSLGSGLALMVLIVGLFVSGDTHKWVSMSCVMLPVLAVAAVSLASAADLDARHETFSANLEFLMKIQPHLQAADTEREFISLVLETEERLLAETASWYSRRCYLGVA